jgi:UDP-N-acetylglucosamine 2-epimerase (non-hydrolysing)
MTRDRVSAAGAEKWKLYWGNAAAAVNDKSKKLLLITMHRRESFGAPTRALLAAIRRLASRHSDWEFVYPVHLNPNVRQAAVAILSGLRNVHLVEALPYEPFVFLMQRSTLILTDSGGIQEEAPSLNKRVVVMRERTERQEAVDAGTVTLAGNSGRGLEKTVERVMRRTHSKKMANVKNPYGDGHATGRILKILLRHSLK